MKRMTMYAVGMALMGLSLVSCSTSSGEKQNTVAVMGTGTVWARPDMAQINVSFAHTASTTQEAKKLCDQTLKAITKILQEEKIDIKNLKTTALSYQADYEYRNGRRVRLGQSAQQNVEITVRNIVKDGGRLSTLLDKLAAISNVEINDISFDIDQKTELFKQSRELAYRKAHEKAEQYAALCGRKLGKVVAIVENSGDDVSSALLSNRAKAEYSANDMATVPTGQNEISTDVQVVFSLK